MPSEFKADDIGEAILSGDWEMVKALIDPGPIAKLLTEAIDKGEWNLVREAYRKVKKAEERRARQSGSTKTKKKTKKKATRKREWPEGLSLKLLNQKIKANGHDYETAADKIKVSVTTLEGWRTGGRAPNSLSWAGLAGYCGVRTPKKKKAKKKKAKKKKAKKKKAKKKGAT